MVARKNAQLTPLCVEEFPGGNLGGLTLRCVQKLNINLMDRCFSTQRELRINGCNECIFNMVIFVVNIFVVMIT